MSDRARRRDAVREGDMSGQGRAVSTDTARALCIQMPLPLPLLTINARRVMHWRTQARHTRIQREAAGYYGKVATPAFPAVNPSPYLTGRVRVDIAVQPYPAQQQPDDTAIIEALKPLLDGFEDVALVDDDAQFFIGSLTWDKTKRTGEIFFTLTEVGAGCGR